MVGKVKEKRIGGKGRKSKRGDRKGGKKEDRQVCSRFLDSGQTFVTLPSGQYGVQELMHVNSDIPLYS